MTDDLDLATVDTPSPKRHRWRWVLLIGTPVVVALAIALALFQPWKLFIDKTVDDAAPVGATPIAVAATPATTEAMPDTTIPAAPVDEVPAATAAPATEVPAPPPTTVPAPPPTTVPPAPVATMFVSLDHGTSGSLFLLADAEGRQYARIENLDTDQGPDVFVYLSTNTVDGSEQAFDDDYVNLGGLQGNLGNQNYEIPAGTDLSRYQSLVIWCDRFDSAFGAAPLPV